MINYDFSLVDFEYWLFVFVRIASFLFVAPIFGQTAVPSRLKAGLAFFVSILMFPMVDRSELAYSSAVGYAIVVLSEVVTGLLIGFAANICNSIVLFAGNIIDMDIGLSMVTEFNPEVNNEVSITGNLYYYFVLLLLITSDMHTYVLRALCDSFIVVPPGRPLLQWDHLLSAMVRYMGDLLVIGFRIFLPFFACIMVLNCILGVMAKVSPQMNMFAVGIQLKVLLGLTVLYLTIYLLPYVADLVFDEIKTMVVLIIDGLRE